MGDVQTPHYPGAVAEGAIFVYVCVGVYVCVSLCRCHTPFPPSVAGCLWASSDWPFSTLKQSNPIPIFGEFIWWRTGERNKESSGQGNFFTGVLNLKIVGHFPVQLISWHFVYYLSIVLSCTDPLAENSKKEGG